MSREDDALRVAREAVRVGERAIDSLTRSFVPGRGWRHRQSAEHHRELTRQVERLAYLVAQLARLTGTLVRDR